MRGLCSNRGERVRRPGSSRLLTGVGMAVLMGLATLAGAQSFLGTIRGTVTDPQGAPVSGAAVLIIDEATGVPRAVETDRSGNYEAVNLRPGTYRVEISTTNFKKVDQTGVVLRASGVSRVDARLEVGAISETITVEAAGSNNITLESQAIARGLDEQQIRDLPRASRDIQDFLLLNPNVVGGTDAIQFLGGRTYGVQYVQDGQASTNAIFGSIGNSAPGLDAISELQVLSNSYSAEYGGLAGVVVTTKRGGNAYRATAFTDYNGSALNALTYGQKRAGVKRGDENADTKQYRYGASLGGPVKSGKTFFFANYEGSRDKSITGGGRATVPTAAMRAGDFSGNNFIIRDPVTGQPFPGNVIPADRIDPAALRIINRFYPLPNQPNLSSGLGIFQEFIPATRNRQRADLRIDHEASSRDSIFARASFQNRNPSNLTFEGGGALTNLPLLQRSIKTASGIVGWTRIWSSTVVNEFRAGYNFDESRRQSNFLAADVNADLGLENEPSLLAEARGYPSFRFTGGASRPTNIVDAGRNADRTLSQNSFSVSNNVSWLLNSHSFKAGGIYNRNLAKDGFGRGLNHRGQYNFSGSRTGHSFADFLLGLPADTREQVSNRGPLEGASNDFALFLQDDWKVNPRLTVFLGARYDRAGIFQESSDLLANWQPIEGGYHIVPSAETRSRLPPALIALNRIRLASEVGVGEGLVNADKNDLSPRVGFAYRLGEDNKTVLRAGFGIFHPTNAAQGVRDLLATNEFRYTIRRNGPQLARGFSTGTVVTNASDFGNQGIQTDLKSPNFYQYNLTLERELPGDMGLRLSYIGSIMRGLLVNRDYNSLPANTNEFNPDDAADRARLPFPLYGSFANIIENTGSGELHAGQVELQRRFKNGFGINAAYTYSHSDSNAPDSGNSSLGVQQYYPQDLELDRGPDPNVVKHRVVANATWDVPVGRGRRIGSNMPGWTNTLFGGWTVSTIFQARSGQNLTPFFSLGYSSITPYNLGFTPDTTNGFGDRWRLDRVGNPASGGANGQFFNPAAYALPAPGTIGNDRRNSLVGPGTWVANFAFYKDVIARKRARLQLTVTLDNAFNHPQFAILPQSPFLDLTDFLINKEADNRSLAVLGAAGTEGNLEGFSNGRVVRFGLRMTF